MLQGVLFMRCSHDNRSLNMRHWQLAFVLHALSAYFVIGLFRDNVHGDEPNEASVTIPEPELTYSDKTHWAFQPIIHLPAPQVQNLTWARSSLDAWILAKLEQEKLIPYQDADPITWFRRTTFLLTGLPPNKESLERFQSDVRPDAKQRAIDRMLTDPDFGIRVAQHWLDIVRFAETDGFEFDKIRPEAWRYRNWVIHALNDDLPYQSFITAQIAGDEVALSTKDSLLATGYLLCGPDMPDINLQDERRHVFSMAITANFGEVVLGLQFGCAQCHDHKTDPISQHDFYRLRAFFEPLDVLRAAPKSDDETAAKQETPKTLRVVHRLDKAPDSRLWVRGDFRRPGPVVQADFRGLSSKHSRMISNLPSPQKADHVRLWQRGYFTNVIH